MNNRASTELADLIYDLLLEGEPLGEDKIRQKLKVRGYPYKLGEIRTALIRLRERKSVRSHERWANRWEVVP